MIGAGPLDYEPQSGDAVDLSDIDPLIPGDVRAYTFVDCRRGGSVQIVRREDQHSDAVPALLELFHRRCHATGTESDLLELVLGRDNGSSAESAISDIVEFLSTSLEIRDAGTIVVLSRAFQNRSVAAAFRSIGSHAGRRVYPINPIALQTGIVERRLVGYPRISTSETYSVLELRTQRAVRYNVYNLKQPFLRTGGPALREILGSRQVIAVIDDEVMRLYGERLLPFFSEYANLLRFLPVSAQEPDKTWESVRAICHEAVAAGLDRSGVFVGIGGGVLLDIVGTAASLYRRGTRYVRIPTTLVGLVDVAVGIKNGFNFAGKKNVLGAFHPPYAAITDRSFLQTLDRRYIACGLAEIIKMGVVCDGQLFHLIEEAHALLLSSKFQQPPILAHEIILRAQASMMDQLEPNLYEDELRRLVDFGHTFSPTIEAATDYALSHGEAVAIDMAISTAIAVQRRFLDLSQLTRLLVLYDQIGLPRTHPVCTVELLTHALGDAKRHRANNLNFIVPTRIGDATFIQHVSESELGEALRMVESVGVAAR